MRYLIRRFSLFLALFTLLGSGLAAAQTLNTDQSNLANMHRLVEHIGGNVRKSSEYIEYQWPAIYFEARFNGPKLIFKIDDGYNRFRLLIDGHEIGIIEQPLASQYEVMGLGASEHVVRLEKLSESLGQVGRFYGFFVENPNQALMPIARTRRIEFIGDSYLAGYGNLSKSRQCPRTLYDMTENTRAYGPIVAQHFGADFQVNAYSGLGMVRNYANNLAGMPMDYFYGRPVFNDEFRTPSAEFAPQIILIALGTNDFSTPIGDNEKWHNNEELSQDYIASHLRFLHFLRAANPNAMILVAANINANSTHLEARAAIAAEITKTDRNLHLVNLPKLQNTGCDWHPNLNEHLSMAQIVISRINELKPNW